MIGDSTELVEPSAVLPSAVLNLPLPFFYSRDSGVALPTAALPYNDMRICFKFRKWSELLLKQEGEPSDNTPATVVNATINDIETEPVLSGAQVWCNYAIVSNDERKRMACAPRDILIEQCQTAPLQSFTPATNATQSFDIRFSHAIKVLFFGVRNKTIANNWSNYTTHSPNISTTGSINHDRSDTVDPIKQTSLIYENTSRLSQMGSDYFSLVQPWYGAPTIPKETGYHMYSYSLDFFNLDPMGSTNFGKLTNVSIIPEASDEAIAQATAGQQYNFIVTAINNNIIRVSGGALGFPVL
jgi:hypothetical protein